MNRPLVLVATACIVGMLLGLTGLLSGIVIPIILVLTGLIMVTGARRWPLWATPGIVLLFLGAGALNWNARHVQEVGDPLLRHVLQQPEDTVYTLEGTVEKPDILLDSGNYLQFTLRADTLLRDGQSTPLRGGVLVRWQKTSDPVFHGERVQVTGQMDATLGRVNHGFRSVEAYRRNQDVHTLIRVYGDDAVQHIQAASSFSPAHLASRFRHILAARLEQAVPEDALPFILTVWLGDRRRIQENTYSTFIESGTAHILAVSGLHMGIVFVSVSYMLGLFIRRPRLRNVLVMTVIFFFAFMAGTRVSSMRAAIMIALYLMAEILDREPDAPTALSIAAIIFTLHDPDVLRDPGFQLSFASIASLLLFRAPLSERLYRLPGIFRDGLSSTLAVQIVPFPLAITLFHVFPVIGIIINLLVIPLLGVILWLAFLTSATAFILPGAAPLFGHAAAPFIYFIAQFTQYAADFPYGHIYLTSPTIWAILVYFCAAACLWVALTRQLHRFRYYLAAGGLILLMPFFWKPWSTPAEATFLDVGHGDAAVIRTPEGQTWLVDTGDNNEFVDTGRRVIAPYLWANHISRLDAIFLSHPDRDHMGGTPYILEHFTVGVLYLGPTSFDTPLENEILAICEQRGIPVLRLKQGDVLSLDDTKLTVLYPTVNGMAGASDNDQSLVFQVSWPGMDLLFTGDIEKAGEAAVTKLVNPVGMVKVPHHGSATSSSPAFVQATRPSIAVVSVGRRGRRSVVRQEVLDRWEAVGAQVYRTDRMGSIRVQTGPDGLEISQARVDKGFPVRKKMAN